MNKHQKILLKILSGASDANISFKALCEMLKYLDFSETVRGSHHIFRHRKIAEKVNLQADGRNAKPYQVRQVRRMLEQTGLGGSHVEI